MLGLVQYHQSEIELFVFVLHSHLSSTWQLGQILSIEFTERKALGANLLSCGDVAIIGCYSSSLLISIIYLGGEKDINYSVHYNTNTVFWKQVDSQLTVQLDFFSSGKKCQERNFLGVFQSNLVITSLLQNENISFNFMHWIKVN